VSIRAKPTTTVDAPIEPLVAEVGEALADAADWYDVVGPAEARAKVMADRDALLHVLSLDAFDAGKATKH
jgi:hypothetical protein